MVGPRFLPSRSRGRSGLATGIPAGLAQAGCLFDRLLLWSSCGWLRRRIITQTTTSFFECVRIFSHMFPPGGFLLPCGQEAICFFLAGCLFDCLLLCSYGVLSGGESYSISLSVCVFFSLFSDWFLWVFPDHEAKADFSVLCCVWPIFSSTHLSLSAMRLLVSVGGSFALRLCDC